MDIVVLYIFLKTIQALLRLAEKAQVVAHLCSSFNL